MEQLPSVVVVDQRLRGYDFGPTHPLGPIRVLLTYDEISEHGLLNDSTALSRLADIPLDEKLLSTVHTADYIAAVKRASSEIGYFDVNFGIGTTDVPRFDNMHDATSNVVAATLTATRAVASGEAGHALNLAGGLHHAMPSKASGFCVYNDIAVSIQWLLDNGFKRIAYIDVDAHHGDGVEACFYGDPRVMTISIHESGKTLFPGTGHASDTGGPGAEGFAVNIALPAGTGDSGWLRAFDAIVPELLESFAPQIVFSQHGCDSHRADPLSNLDLTIDGQRISYRMIHDLAHKYADGKWIAVGGGGYAMYEVVPRIWTHLAAIVTHNEAAVAFTDGENPTFKSFATGWDPHDEIDRSIMATRRSIFPIHGLIADPNASF